jgi:hypothetical protein
MGGALLAPAVQSRLTEHGDDGDLVAITLTLDGRQYNWCALGINDDPDVLAWAAARHASYAALYWRDLLALRAAHAG